MKHLSEKQQKRIQDLARGETPRRIARKLKLPKLLVEQELGRHQVARIPQSDPDPEDSVVFRCFLGLLFIAPLFVVDAVADNVNYPKAALIQIATLLFLFLHLRSNRTRRLISLRECKLHIPLLTCLCWIGLSILWATSGYDAFMQWAHWAACSILFLLAFRWIGEANRVQSVYTTLAFSAAIVTAIGLGQYYFDFSWIRQGIPPAATFGNRNQAAHFAIFTIPCVIAAWHRSERASLIWAWTLCMGLSCAFIYHVQSMAAWIAAAGQAIFLFLILLREWIGRGLRLNWMTANHFWSGVAGCGLTLVLILNPAGHEKSDVAGTLYEVSAFWSEEESSTREETSQATVDLSTAKIRLTLWTNTWELIKAEPFIGVGAMNWRDHYARFSSLGLRDTTISVDQHPHYAHNDYIQALAEFGIIGAALILWTGFVLFIRAYRVLIDYVKGKARNSFQDILPICSLISMASVAAFSFPAYRAMPPLLFAVFSAILFRIPSVSMSSGRGQASHPTPLPGFQKRLPFAAGCIVALWTTIHFFVLKSEIYLRRSHFEYAEQDWSGLHYWSLKGQKWNPFNRDLLLPLAEAQYHQGDIEKARSTFFTLERRFPYTPFSLYRAAKFYKSIGEFPKAEKLLRDIDQLIPANGIVHDAMGRVYWDQGRTDDALREFRMATIYRPEESYSILQPGRPSLLPCAV